MTAYVSGPAGTPAKSVRVIVRPSHTIHLGRDAVEQAETIVSDLIQVEVGAAWQKGELRMAAEAVECGLQTVGGSIQVKGVVCATMRWIFPCRSGPMVFQSLFSLCTMS